MVSPNKNNFSVVPERIPLLICLATIGGFREIISREGGCISKDNKEIKTLTPFGNSASTEQIILQVLFPVLIIEYCVHAANVFPY
jgi:hypothetical protein